MREAIALIIVVLMWAFAATKANGFVTTQQSQQDLLQPVIQYIQTDQSLNRNEKIADLSTHYAQETNQYVQIAIKDIINLLIEQENQENHQPYGAFLQNID